MTKPLMFDKNGNPIDVSVLPDGGRVVVPKMIMDAAPRAPALAVMDGAQHRPGYATSVSDQDRERRSKMVQDANAKLSNRWRNPPALAADATRLRNVPQPPVAAKDLNGLYAQADRKLEQRWKGAAA